MTPTDEADTGDRDVPRLPTASPSPAPSPASSPESESASTDGPTLPDAPYVPAPTVPTAAAPAAPVAAEPAPFDAKAMVESQKHFNANPAYGTLPTGTEAGREAAQELRVQAQRKRRRNQLIGQAVAFLLLGGVGVAGWFGYRAYQGEQDSDAAEIEAEGADESAGESIIDAAESAADALTPLDEQQEVVEGLDELNDTTIAGGGGLQGAVEDARDIVDQAESDDIAVPAVDPFAARTVDFIYRRWDAAAATSPMVEYVVLYDRIADTYMGDIRPDDGTLTITGTNDGYRSSIYPDGVVERVPRSEASLDPAPDIALAMVFRADDVLPPEARPFATLVEEVAGTEQGDTYGYVVDTIGWRDREPASFLAWVNRWHPRPLDDERFVDITSREISTEETDTTALLETTRTETMTQGIERTTPGAAVTYVVADDGHVVAVAIIDNTAEFRAEYTLLNAHDEPRDLDLGDRNWVAAP